MLIFAGFLFVMAILAAGVDYCLDNVAVDFSWAVRILLFGAAVLIGINTVLHL